jgi:hypothetical protein
MMGQYISIVEATCVRCFVTAALGNPYGAQVSICTMTQSQREGGPTEPVRIRWYLYF